MSRDSTSQRDLADIEVLPPDGGDEDLALVGLGGVRSVHHAPLPALVVELLTTTAQDVRTEYARRIAPHRGFDRRRQSVVERRVQARARTTMRALRAARCIEFSEGSLCVDRGAIEHDLVNHEHLLFAHLRVAWSWPSLPVVVGATDYSDTSAVLRLRLRRRTRVRYPVRYYEAAHSALGSVARLSVQSP